MVSDIPILTCPIISSMSFHWFVTFSAHRLVSKVKYSIQNVISWLSSSLNSVCNFLKVKYHLIGLKKKRVQMKHNKDFSLISSSLYDHDLPKINISMFCFCSCPEKQLLRMLPAKYFVRRERRLFQDTICRWVISLENITNMKLSLFLVSRDTIHQR